MKKLLDMDSEKYMKRLVRIINKSQSVYFGTTRVRRACVGMYNPTQDAWQRHPGKYLVITTMGGARFAIGAPYSLHDGSGNEIVASRE